MSALPSSKRAGQSGSAPKPNYSKGVMAKYARQVSQADDGAVTGA